MLFIVTLFMESSLIPSLFMCSRAEEKIWVVGLLTYLQSNLYITALCIAGHPSLYITVTGELPKIFSCLIFSAKLTCI